LGADLTAELAKEVRHELVLLPYYGVFDNLAYKVGPDGTVTLLGQVARPTLKSDAENVVKKIEGVEKVDNQIKVLPVSGNDDQIRRATYRAIYGNSTLAPYSMRAVPPIRGGRRDGAAHGERREHRRRREPVRSLRSDLAVAGHAPRRRVAALLVHRGAAAQRYRGARRRDRCTVVHPWRDDPVGVDGGRPLRGARGRPAIAGGLAHGATPRALRGAAMPDRSRDRDGLSRVRRRHRRLGT